MPTSSITPGGLKRYSRWLAVQKAKGRVPSATETSAFLQGEIEANIATDIGREQLSLSREQVSDARTFNQGRLDLLEDAADREQRANKIRGVTEIAKLGLGINEGTEGALWEGAKAVGARAYDFASNLFSGDQAGQVAADVGGEFASFADAFDVSSIASATIPEWDVSLSVLCTELYRQGLMPEETYIKDCEFGNKLPALVMLGYRVWAVPVARLMRKSRLVTMIMKYPVLAWANHMAGQKNWFGAMALKIGVPICSAIGAITYSPRRMEA